MAKQQSERSVFATIRNIISTETGTPINKIASKTPFMSNGNITFFDCIGVLFLLQHIFKVELPESEYAQYKTVRDLARIIHLKTTQPNNQK